MYKKISLILAATHPPKKIIYLCIILWILVQSYAVNDIILFGGHYDLYIMVQRFCLVSLTITNRKTSYRSLKQIAGSTSCPWTTILVSEPFFLFKSVCLSGLLHGLQFWVFLVLYYIITSFPFSIIWTFTGVIFFLKTKIQNFIQLNNRLLYYWRGEVQTINVHAFFSWNVIFF